MNPRLDPVLHLVWLEISLFLSLLYTYRANIYIYGCAQSTDYLNTSFQMMVMSPAAEPSGCPYVTKLQP